MLSKAIRLVQQIFSLIRILDFRSLVRFVTALISTAPGAVHSKSLVAAYRAMWGHENVFTLAGQRIRLPGEWFGYAAEIYARQVYTWHPEFHLKPDMTVIDLGAAGGVFSVYAGMQSRRVLAVEAHQESVTSLQRNIALNRLTNVEAIWGIVGGGSGDVTKGGESSFYAGAPLLEFEQLLVTHCISQVDFLKVDIEGSEFDLFRTAAAWTHRVRRIAMEVHPEFGDPLILQSMFRTLGFQVVLTDLDRRTVPRIVSPAGYLYAWRL